MNFILVLFCQWVLRLLRRPVNAELPLDGCYVVNYLDNFIGVASPDKTLQDYEACGSLLRDLGLQESPSKAYPPSTVLTCLGLEVNTLDLTFFIRPERLQELETSLL